MEGFTFGKLSSYPVAEAHSDMFESLVFHSHKAMKDFTFSDGTFIPRGCYVATTSIGLHEDSQSYTNPTVFDPWRFFDGDDASNGTKNQIGRAHV